MAKRVILTGVVAAGALIFLAGAAWLWLAGQEITGPQTSSAKVATWVGSETCAACHQAEGKLWRPSQHAHAMAHAADKTVLGDFNEAAFEYAGVRSRFFRKDGKFLVETDGPDGRLATFEVKYTFGVDPLQQYLIEFADGRIQALSIAWDSRPKEKGGQKWFHLYPNENIRSDDVLHWTKLNQNWNFMCAECHSTGVQKNYDATADRFATTWAEISVGCEACHGAGSRHVAWARQQGSWWPSGKTPDRTKGLVVRFDDRAGVAWTQNDKTGKPERSGMPLGLRKEVETCGLCHARRDQLSENWTPGWWLSNTHQVVPPSRMLTYADGQMRDNEEIYNYISFKQSKMYAVGVTCSDCHDPHSAKLRAPGDNVCAQCHLPSKYESATHHHHQTARSALSCASCHMPERTYMVVDRRHDHGFRVPRPDQSVAFETPNVCNDCHRDKPAQWAASAIESWFGPQRQGFQTYAGAFHAAWSEQPDAEALLNRFASDGSGPAVARAGALSALAAYLSASNAGTARKALTDSDPMVRSAALEMLEAIPARQLWPLVSPLLSDPVASVRIRAVSVLAGVSTTDQPVADRDAFERAASEFVAAYRLNADRPEARTVLANFLVQRGKPQEAELEFQAARRLNPQFTPATINLADLYRALGRDNDAVTLLRAAISEAPRDASLHYAYGLSLVRQKNKEEALAELRRAAELAPNQAHYGYALAVGLHSAGRIDEAISLLKDHLARHPADRELLIALVTFNRDTANFAAALEYAERLGKAVPDDPRIKDLINSLRRQIENPPR